MANTNTHTRISIEQTLPQDRPTIRCNLEGIKYNGRIIIDGNNPWIEIFAPGHKPSMPRVAKRIGWSLALELLNDPYSRPLDFDDEI